VTLILPLEVIQCFDIFFFGLVYLDCHNFIIHLALVDQTHDSENKVVRDSKHWLKLFPAQVNDIDCVTITTKLIVAPSSGNEAIVKCRGF